MMLRCRIIIKDIVEQMTVDFVGLTKQFTQKAPDKKSVSLYLHFTLFTIIKKNQTFEFKH